jgi:hypothetical protein
MVWIGTVILLTHRFAKNAATIISHRLFFVGAPPEEVRAIWVLVG